MQPLKTHNCLRDRRISGEDAARPDAEAC